MKQQIINLQMEESDFKDLESKALFCGKGLEEYCLYLLINTCPEMKI